MKTAICSLGCAKNLVDSERMMAILKEYGYELWDDIETAEIIIINTCGFIEPAKVESINTIIEALPLKQKHCRCLVVTGCMVKKYGAELKKEIPEVDIWLTSLNFETIGDELNTFFRREYQLTPYEKRRVQTTPTHWAYLKIAEGCNNRCTFCTIPEMRGPYVSRPMPEVISEAKELIASGVKEIILLAQDTTVYGKDLYGEPKLKELLKELVKLDVQRIRILYSYPDRIDRELLELMAKETKICNYLDIPMQHSEDRVLKAMGRPERRRKLDALLKMIREVNPDFAVRSTFIVGFPGETEEDLENLCDFLKSAKLDWVGAFPYSQEEGTVAAALPNQIPEEIKNDRYDTVMALLSRCSAEQTERWLGKKDAVLIEGETEEGCEYPYYGRTTFQAPEVDGIIYLETDKEYRIGDSVNVEIIGNDVYDLIGKIL